MTKHQEESVLSVFFTEIAIISQLSFKAFEQVLPRGLTVSQFSVLNNLSRLGDGKSPSVLANAFQVTKGAMTNTLTKLESSGLVEVRADETDRRGKQVFLTPAGINARTLALKSQAHLLEELMGPFKSTDFAKATPLLAKLRAHLDAARD
jgi:DNA-binding MarR family transcriptional regulator